MKTVLDVVITELESLEGTQWFMNIGKYNSEDDIRITPTLAKLILDEQAYMRKPNE
jgi:hypothetical protein